MLRTRTRGNTRADGEQPIHSTARPDRLTTTSRLVPRVESVALKGNGPSVQIRLESAPHR